MKAVFFDLDGTLLDTAPDFALVINRMRRRHGREALPFAHIRNTVSHGARALIQLAFELREGEDGFEALKRELLDLYLDNLAEQTTLFPGMAELLGWLEQQQLAWGIVTNKPRLYTDPILAALDLDQRCQAVVCPDDVSHSKPHPEPLLLAARQAGCPPNQAIYIGDHRRDIEAGAAAGMTTIAASYGYIDPTDPAEQWRADHLVEQPQQLLPLLAKQLQR